MNRKTGRRTLFVSTTIAYYNSVLTSVGKRGSKSVPGVRCAPDRLKTTKPLIIKAVSSCRDSKGYSFTDTRMLRGRQRLEGDWQRMYVHSGSCAGRAATVGVGYPHFVISRALDRNRLRGRTVTPEVLGSVAGRECNASPGAKGCWTAGRNNRWTGIVQRDPLDAFGLVAVSIKNAISPQN